MAKTNYAGTCPKCNMPDCLDYGVMQLCDESVYYPYVCGECGFAGNEYYSLVFDTHTDRNGVIPKDKNFSKKA